jgi:hypothetical protein
MKFSEKHIHIVSFDVPWPADYGGVIDVFGKLKALHALGVNVHLHCFQYGRKESDVLKNLCHSVHYYPRNESRTLLFNRLPYIVISRANEELLFNLSADDYPVLFEGLHTSYFLNDPALAHKKRMVRAHNVEHEYYRQLASHERNFARKYFFGAESSKLLKYEKVLAGASAVAAISENENIHFNHQYHNSFLLPAFHLHEQVNSRLGKGDFALYHANLSVNDNVEAVEFLMNEVFNGLNIPLIVAGQNPTDDVKQLFEKPSIHKLIANPSAEQMEELVSSAHVQVLPAFSVSGIRLKLLHSLFNGRFCLVNPMMTANTGLESLCIHAETANDFKKRISEVFRIELKQAEIERRQLVLNDRYSNTSNAELLLQNMFEL